LLLILNLLDGKKLIRELCLINLLIISPISLSFKGYRIYLLNVKDYLFYFDDQHFYKNRCINPWTELMIYQFIIFIFIIFSLIFYSNLLLFQYIVGRLNKISLEFDLVFMIIQRIYFVCDNKVKIIFWRFWNFLFESPILFYFCIL
jgi:hypothetical protein